LLAGKLLRETRSEMDKRVHLPLAHENPRASSIAADGRRQFVYPADVSGRFATVRKAVFFALVVFWVALPLLKMDGRPLVLLDVMKRQFFLFGATFNAQDAWLAFFLITGVGFGLALMTSLAGRVFCGFACPQTVFLEGVFRPIERLIEGSREKRMRRDKGPMSLEKLGRKLVKHALFLLAAFLIAHIVLSFFVPVPQTLRMITQSPAEHPEAFAWASCVTLALYANFAWFREQVCLVVCPYGRLQASLVDDDTLVVGYDEKRGEPRGKVGATGSGDCVDCKRCVVVCPTGIDIRNGLQLDCVGCTACIDACDDVMEKLHRPRGLVRYDSKRSLAGGQRRIWRPRLLVYGVLGLAGLVVATIAARSRTSFEANLTRAPGAPFVVESEAVRNSFVLHLVNKSSDAADFELSAMGVELSTAAAPIHLAGLSDAKLPVVVIVPLAARPSDEWTLVVRRLPDGETRTVKAKLVRPNR
jgi:cytochrome c oxidase accessory protein FixG